ncbi:unnamed protein product [Timema podura]|uniref:Uncharacterized protein n=1 Tax=Timema podura TaxID=61482 RepID=A0ABN7NW88_TIMPD|nr:unnamed protein product [Timema podura]
MIGGDVMQAHSSVEKAGLIGLVKMRYIETDDKLSLRGDKLKEAIARDRDKGLIPFFKTHAQYTNRDLNSDLHSTGKPD